MLRILSLLCLLFLQIDLQAQKPDLTGWKRDSLPSNEKAIIYNNRSPNFTFLKKGNQWIVEQKVKTEKSIIGDKLPVSLDFLKTQIPSFEIGTAYTQKVYNGYFISHNMGEFGGGLYFLDTTGTIATVQKMSCCSNVNGFFGLGENLFFIDGLSHLGSDYGSLQELIREKGVWQVKIVKYLREAPIKTVATPEGVLIFTNARVYQFTFDRQLKELFKAPFYWGILYPSLVLVDEQDLYIAMRGGVLKVTDFAGRQQYTWYTPQ